MTTPDERSQKLAVQMLGRAMNAKATIDLIASAIREAENAALERAEDLVSELSFELDDALKSPPVLHAVDVVRRLDEVARSIRALKFKKD